MNFTVFRHLAIVGAGPAPSAAELRAIEEELGAVLPSSFVEYLHAANGGYLEYAIDVPTGSGATEALSFCGLFSARVGSSCDETFVGEIRSGREYMKIPQGVLPFARDGGGSIVYLDLTSTGKGRVVAFVEGLPGWAGKRTQSALVELAASFDDYVNKLKVDIDSITDHLEHDVTELSDIESIEALLDVGLPTWRSDLGLVNLIRLAKERVQPNESS